VLGATLGVCLGWGFATHISTDVVVSQFLRRGHADAAQSLAAVVPDHSALVAYWGNADPVGPILLERDIVVIQPRVDEGEDAPKLIRELLAMHRRVFVREDGFSPQILARVLAGLQITRTVSQSPDVVEVGPVQ
jgi:hypothetical protein